MSGMFEGIPRTRLLLYGAALAALVAINLRGWESGGDAVTASGDGQDGPMVVVTPPLEALRDLDPPQIAASRDLFLRPAERVAPAVSPVVTSPAPAQPDPSQVARAQAAKTFESMTLIGVMRDGDRVLALLELEGRSRTLGIGEEVLPGYTVGAISTNTIRIEQKRLGMAAVLTVGGSAPATVLGVDG